MNLFLEFMDIEHEHPMFVRPEYVVAILEGCHPTTKAIFTVIVLEDGRTLMVKESAVRAKVMISEALANRR